MIRTLLVDDHPVARHGIKSFLVDRVKDAVIGEAPHAAHACTEHAPPPKFARRALSAGAVGNITKDSKLDEFLTAVEHPRRGRRYISRDTADLLLRQGAKWESLAHESLSDREYQVLRLIGSGQTLSDIGRDLGLSVKTVSTYRARVLEKLGMRANAESMRYAMENELLES